MDWDRERERAGQATQDSLSRLAQQAGFSVDHARGKGSHIVVTGGGLRRPLVIPSKIYRVIAVKIIAALREATQDDE